MPFVAYCDESCDGERKKFLSFSGYVAEEEAWKGFAVRWQKVLDQHNIPDFHAADCEKGYGVFAGMPLNKRNQIQSDLIGVIINTSLLGIPFGIELKKYNQYAARIKKLMSIPSGLPISGSTGDAYNIAMQQLVKKVAQNADLLPISKGEKIAFVFDLQSEYQGRARGMIDALAQRTDLEWTNRIRQSINYASRNGDDAFAPLQAADMLAYEFYRNGVEYIEPRPDHPKPRWQWQLLTRKNCDDGTYAIDENFDEAMAMYQRQDNKEK